MLYCHETFSAQVLGGRAETTQKRNLKSSFPQNTMTNHQYPETVRLNIHSYSKIHYATNLPSDVVAKVSRLIYRDDPIFFEDCTYFPMSFREQDLLLAFTSINTNTGWTVETRAGRKSLFGEIFNDGYKIRIALHCNQKRADLITANPVSVEDRRTHPDFLKMVDGF